MVDPIRAHVQKAVLALAADDASEQRKIHALEAAGHRLITGGQTGPGTWDIIDWRTNEVLAEGDGDLEGYAEAARRLDPEDTWYHHDQLMQDITEVDSTEGVPDSLAEVLLTWVEGASDEELSVVTGWDAAELDRQRQSAS